jgi:hypothetical protein
VTGTRAKRSEWWPCEGYCTFFFPLNDQKWSPSTFQRHPLVYTHTQLFGPACCAEVALMDAWDTEFVSCSLRNGANLSYCHVIGIPKIRNSRIFTIPLTRGRYPNSGIVTWVEMNSIGVCMSLARRIELSRKRILSRQAQKFQIHFDTGSLTIYLPSSFLKSTLQFQCHNWCI